MDKVNLQYNDLDIPKTNYFAKEYNSKEKKAWEDIFK